MPDATRMSPSPRDWAEAFAELPLEEAPTQAWSRTRAALPELPSGSARRGTMPFPRLAMAAMLGATAVGGWLAFAAHQRTSPAVEVVRGTRQEPMRPAPASRIAITPARESSRTGVPVSRAADASAVSVARAESVPPSVAAVATTPRIAGRRHYDDRPQPVTATAAALARPTQPATAVLDGLRTESARLESLVALTRDDRLKSGPALVLAGEIEDRLHVIDAALSDPVLTDTDRVDLWTQRVATLGELARLEGTQRLMAARGIATDALARVD